MKFNQPILKINDIPVFWAQEIFSGWNCRNCGVRQEETVTFEVWVFREKTNSLIKKYLCLSCAEKMLKEVKSKVAKMKKDERVDW